MKSSAFAIAAIASFVLVTSGSAMAGDRFETETRTVVVQTADLNLTSAQGQAQFERRFNAAVLRVCPRPENNVNLREKRQQQLCLAQVRQTTSAQVANIRTNVQFAAVAPKTPPSAVLAP
jgi:UrcA family protein